MAQPKLFGDLAGIQSQNECSTPSKQSPHNHSWEILSSTDSSVVVTPSQTHGLKAMVGIFVTAIADVHQAETDLRFVVEAVHDIERGSEVKTAAQGANAVVPLDG